MAELPKDKVNPEPPFTRVGVDVFGPWAVVTRCTRGGSAYSKRWAVLFTCLCTRAVHIELIESMSASSFINALRRLFSVRGPAKLDQIDILLLLCRSMQGAAYVLKSSRTSKLSSRQRMYMDF